ncbi:MFS transporter [Nocardia vulneris]|uniref:MFS transporter n=1 Tax=Nocardia vulneris TaxID=1141657 RepID=UPI0030D5BFDE
MVLFKGIGELIPFYAVYALLFAEHGLSTGQISSLFAIWSVTAFLLEVPSGAWADTVSRRALLVLSGVLLTAGFALWTLVPTYFGFASGFVLWGAAGALASGTFEALLYDDLVVRGAQSAYPRLLGYTRAASETAVVIGIVAATPLYLWGGYALIGWSSVGFAALHTLLAFALPSAPKSVSAADIEELEDEAGEEVSCPPGSVDHATSPFARYLDMLKTGVGESVRVRAVRNGVFLGALLFGVTAFDEYFALLAEAVGVTTAVVPLLVGLTVVGSLVGSLLAGRTEGMSARTMAYAVGAGGFLFVGGALVTGLAEQHPGAVYLLAGLGFTAIGLSYGLVYNAGIVAAARLQDAIEGPARATVTSVSGLLGEVVALAVFAFAALATTVCSLPVAVALLGATLLPMALATPAWLPPKPALTE